MILKLYFIDFTLKSKKTMIEQRFLFYSSKIIRSTCKILISSFIFRVIRLSYFIYILNSKNSTFIIKSKNIAHYNRFKSLFSVKNRSVSLTKAVVIFKKFHV